MSLLGTALRRALLPSRCGVRTCPRRRSTTVVYRYRRSAWCADHTDAIFAGVHTDEAKEIAMRLGARRWLLLAEIATERERVHVPVLEQIIAKPLREFDRLLWDRRVKDGLYVDGLDLGPRVDELEDLGVAVPTQIKHRVAA